MQFWICERGVRKPSFEFLLLIWHRYYIDNYCLIALIGSVHFIIKTLSINDFFCVHSLVPNIQPTAGRLGRIRCAE